MIQGPELARFWLAWTVRKGLPRRFLCLLLTLKGVGRHTRFRALEHGDLCQRGG